MKGDFSLVSRIVILFISYHSDILSVTLKSSQIFLGINKPQWWIQTLSKRKAGFLSLALSAFLLLAIFCSPKIWEDPSPLSPSPRSATEPVNFTVVSLQTNWTVLTNYPPVNYLYILWKIMVPRNLVGHQRSRSTDQKPLLSLLHAVDLLLENPYTSSTSLCRYHICKAWLRGYHSILIFCTNLALVLCVIFFCIALFLIRS